LRWQRWGAWALPAGAQSAEVKDKPPLYSYIANWAIPRAHWGEVDKALAADQKVLDQALGKGTLVGYGSDVNLVHGEDGATHDNWWSAMSMAGLFNVLDEIYRSGTPTSPVLASATKHWDNVYVSRYYNWHPGSWKGLYTHAATYKLKADAPDDALDSISRNFVVPVMEKLLADGTLAEYEVDEEAVHTGAPGTFLVIYLAANAEGVDKVNVALQQALKSNPMAGSAIGSMVDLAQHRDYLSRTSAIYK
jgi:hypothetical protein